MTEEQVRTGWLLTRISGGPTEAAKSSPGTFLGFAGARCSGFGNFRVDLREPFSRSRLKSAAAEAVKLGPAPKLNGTVKSFDHVGNQVRKNTRASYRMIFISTRSSGLHNMKENILTATFEQTPVSGVWSLQGSKPFRGKRQPWTLAFKDQLKVA